jgi:hypothetical protein
LLATYRTLPIARYLFARHIALKAWRNRFASLMADPGEHEAAKIQPGGLLASGTETEPQEQRFRLDRQQELGSVEISSVEIST